MMKQILTVLLLSWVSLSAQVPRPTTSARSPGWTVGVGMKLVDDDAAFLEGAMQLLRTQFDEIGRAPHTRSPIRQLLTPPRRAAIVQSCRFALH